MMSARLGPSPQATADAVRGRLRQLARTALLEA
jgi:hypothetical protein